MVLKGGELNVMLKIKDNVDLKELEKFGFQARYDEFSGELVELYKTGLYNEIRGTKISICPIKKAHLLSFQKENYTLHHGISRSSDKKVFWGLVYYTNKDLTTDGWMFRHTKGRNGGRSVYLLDDIYDLVKANLVEKVEDK